MTKTVGPPYSGKLNVRWDGKGMAYFYRHVVSKKDFSDIDQPIWRMTWNWARRRRPKKRLTWIKWHYYARRAGRDWIFTDGTEVLLHMVGLPIRRHILIGGGLILTVRPGRPIFNAAPTISDCPAPIPVAPLNRSARVSMIMINEAGERKLVHAASRQA